MCRNTYTRSTGMPPVYEQIQTSMGKAENDTVETCNEHYLRSYLSSELFGAFVVRKKKKKIYCHKAHGVIKQVVLRGCIQGAQPASIVVQGHLRTDSSRVSYLLSCFVCSFFPRSLIG